MALAQSATSKAENVPVISVAELTQRIKDTLSQYFTSVWVTGEVSEVSRPSSGHVYLTLKDATAQIKAVVWRSTAARLPFQIEEGQKVICCGDVDVFPPRGSYQLILKQIEPQGVGALQLAFQQLLEKLTKEGLFHPSRKKTVPLFPRHIAFVTSPSGAAVRDFLQVATRRWRGIQLTIIPAKVQGVGAAEDIVRGIQMAHKLSPRPEVLVVGRGGGSLEDLWCFNEEIVVRAVAQSEIPTVSAVGHEIDVTLCDLAADVRALTPSEAAERLVPAAQEWQASLIQLGQRLQKALRQQATRSREKLHLLESRRVFRRPFEIIRQLQQQTDDLQTQLQHLMPQQVAEAHKKLSHFAARLESLSPLAVLSRGYSVTQRTDSGEVVRSAAAVHPGDFLTTRVAQGTIISLVEIINHEE